MLIKNDYKPRMLPREVKQAKPVTSNGRIVLVLGTLAMAFAMLIGRGIYLQTEKHEFLKEQGDQRFVRTLPLVATRGTITDRNGAALAISAPADSLYAVPSAMEQMPADCELQQLSALIEVPVSTIESRLSGYTDLIDLKRRWAREVA
ncbi:MAG: penicillin-binding protein 2, partial [Snodgrassella sp.]|nr:penicillin-binding protein 2 [Snodgrassella sp.]